MTKYKINYQKYLTGAGILILENFNDEWIVTLFKDHTKTYADIGGLYESKHVSIKDTAIQELVEESRNLFKINNKDLLKNYLDIKYNKYKDDYYRVYFLNITQNSKLLADYNTIFENNKYIIDNDKDYSKCWKETTKMKRFYLKDLIKFKTNDINGINHKIRTRVKDIIKYINKLDNFEMIIPDSLNLKKVYNKDKTVSFILIKD
tara:strand:+ start:2545 stop:3159 length:615 start_codon:yes stop_codon:yes gene_type:complete